jgi:hypothetical protein
MKVDLYFAGAAGRHAAAFIGRHTGVPCDTSDAGILTIPSVEYNALPKEIFKRPRLMKAVEIRDSSTGAYIHPEVL